MIPRRLLKSCALCALVVMATTANANSINSENFDGFTDGSIEGQGSPAWVVHSPSAGATGDMVVTSGSIAVSQDSGSDDAHVIVSGTPFTTGVVSMTFDMIVTAPGAMTGTDFEYFAHFWQSGATTSFRSRTDIQAPNGAGDYTLGIATQSSASEIALPVDFAFGAAVPVTIEFDLDAGISTLTAGGASVSSSVVSLGQAIDGFAFRQSNSSSDETAVIDNLVFCHTPVPEPAACLLAIASLCGLIVCRRR